MREMPWPGIDSGKLAGNEALKKYAGEEFPASWCWTPAGKLFPTPMLERSIGPEKVLTDLGAIFAETPTALCFQDSNATESRPVSA